MSPSRIEVVSVADPIVAQYDYSLHARIGAPRELIYRTLEGQRQVRSGSGMAIANGRMVLIESGADMLTDIRPDTGTLRGLPLNLLPTQHARGLGELGLQAVVAGEDRCGRMLLAFGSGATRAQRAVARIRIEGGANELSIHAVPSLYAALAELPGFATSPLDISGAVLVRKGRLHLRLLHRGCGVARGEVEALPATVDIPFEDFLQYLERCRRDADTPFDPGLLRDPQRYDLGTIEGIPVGFTDATTLGPGQVVFVAAAQEGREAGRNSGMYVGSILGVIEPDGSARYTMLREQNGLETRRCGDGLAMHDASRGHLVFNQLDGMAATLCQMEVRGL